IAISITVISLLLSLGTSLWFLFGVLLSVLILFINNGVEIDPKNMKYRSYKTYYWIKKGEWKNIPLNSSLVILTKTGTQSTSGGRGAQEISRSGLYYELYLMNSEHRNRFYIDNSENKLEIETTARKISEKTGIAIKS